MVFFRVDSMETVRFDRLSVWEFEISSHWREPWEWRHAHTHTHKHPHTHKLKTHNNTHTSHTTHTLTHTHTHTPHTHTKAHKQRRDKCVNHHDTTVAYYRANLPPSNPQRPFSPHLPLKDPSLHTYPSKTLLSTL